MDLSVKNTDRIDWANTFTTNMNHPGFCSKDHMESNINSFISINSNCQDQKTAHLETENFWNTEKCNIVPSTTKPGTDIHSMDSCYRAFPCQNSFNIDHMHTLNEVDHFKRQTLSLNYTRKNRAFTQHYNVGDMASNNVYDRSPDQLVHYPVNRRFCMNRNSTSFSANSDAGTLLQSKHSIRNSDGVYSIKSCSKIPSNMSTSVPVKHNMFGNKRVTSYKNKHYPNFHPIFVQQKREDCSNFNSGHMQFCMPSSNISSKFPDKLPKQKAVEDVCGYNTTKTNFDRTISPDVLYNGKDNFANIVDTSHPNWDFSTLTLKERLKIRALTNLHTRKKENYNLYSDYPGKFIQNRTYLHSALFRLSKLGENINRKTKGVPTNYCSNIKSSVEKQKSGVQRYISSKLSEDNSNLTNQENSTKIPSNRKLIVSPKDHEKPYINKYNEDTNTNGCSSLVEIPLCSQVVNAKAKSKRKLLVPKRSISQENGFKGVTIRFKNVVRNKETLTSTQVYFSSRKLRNIYNRKRRQRILKAYHRCWMNNGNNAIEKPHAVTPHVKQCSSCGTKKTPLWRDADGIPLCNACGIRYKKYRVRCFKCCFIPKKDCKICLNCGGPLSVSLLRSRCFY